MYSMDVQTQCELKIKNRLKVGLLALLVFGGSPAKASTDRWSDGERNQYGVWVSAITSYTNPDIVGLMYFSTKEECKASLDVSEVQKDLSRQGESFAVDIDMRVDRQDRYKLRDYPIKYEREYLTADFFISEDLVKDMIKGQDLLIRMSPAGENDWIDTIKFKLKNSSAAIRTMRQGCLNDLRLKDSEWDETPIQWPSETFNDYDEWAE